MRRYARRDGLVRLQHIFRALPAWVGRKVISSRISREDRAAQTRWAIEMLAKARACTQVFLSLRHIQRLEEKPLVNEGALTEQFIGQELLTVRNRRNGRDGNAEVDYVDDHEGMILPIEVKAGKSGRLKSLHQFMHRKGGSRAIRFNMHMPSREEVEAEVSLGGRTSSPLRFQLYSFHLYFAGRLDAILKHIG